MNDIDFCADIKTGLGALFSCAHHGEFYRIRTPYLYPDGDNIDLFCKTEDGVITVSDLGETTRWLRMQTLSPRRSPKQSALLNDACQTHGVEFFQGALLARCRSHDSLAAVVLRVAQAALRVSDLWFTFRTRSIESVNEEVADWLAERHLDFTRAEKIPGRSGRAWMPDFHVRAPVRSSLIFVLATGSRSAARPVAEHVLAAWYDLSHMAVGPESLRFVSLFDDTADVWREEDFKLLEPLSAIARWSQPERLAGLLEEAVN
jgi:hypothetical protein